MAPNKLTRRPAWAAIPQLQVPNRLRAFFDDPFFAALNEPLTDDMLPEPLGWNPAVDVTETDEAYIFGAELPGMQREDVTITFEKDVLTIRGEKVREEKKVDEGERKFHLWERTYGAFQRTFTFPATVVPEKISAEIMDGILTVKVPKAPEAKSNARKIEIKPR